MDLVPLRPRCWPAKFYITGCNESAAQHVIANIKSNSTNTEAIWICCDHANLASVKEAVEVISTKESRLDVLMANVGVIVLSLGLTNDGYELSA
ncbi:hypothetical protein F4801DRAFT_546441 [Xylaria longipes]|nr:hypothetical protein F4801DRAFT_546441 [Xylaria longipes]